ncbi:MAG: hypothetical protein ABR536_03360 [Solirubrobacterales bacterium]
MRRFLSPKRIRLALQGLKGVRAGGGPRRIKLVNVTEPKGLIVPTSELTFEVEAKDGTANRIKAPVPMPFFYGWGYRIGRALHLPVLSRFDPKKVRFDIKVPRRD